jgi:cytochrome c-type biogenesis protein
MLQDYYYWLSTLSRVLSQPLGDLADQLNVPLMSALIFGLLGAFAPCQLSTGAAAASYVARSAGEPRRMWMLTMAYVAGKGAVYLAIGGGIVVTGMQMSELLGQAVPVAAFARRALGPLLVIAGLVLAGVLKPRFSLGAQAASRIEQRLGGQAGVAPAFGMGAAFAVTFCPTLFWLFFGLTIPLALASPGGVVLPGVFALGTALPLLAFAALLNVSSVNVPGLLRSMRAFDAWAQRAAGIVFVLIGINEIVLYWLL